MIVGISCIYIFINIVNGHCYVGQTIDQHKRWKDHKIELKLNRHKNQHIQNAWNKYGEECFKFNVLEVCNKCDLSRREQHWMNTLKPVYNKAPAAGSPAGFKHSQETRDKLSNQRKGKKRSETTKLAISIGGKGRIFSKDHKMNLSLSHKGKTQSQETKDKRAVSMRGNKNAAGRKHPFEEIEMRRKAVIHGKMKAKAIRNFIYQSEVYFWLSDLTAS